MKKVVQGSNKTSFSISEGGQERPIEEMPFE